MSLVYSVETDVTFTTNKKIFTITIVGKILYILDYTVKKLKFSSPSNAYSFDFTSSEKYSIYANYDKIYTKEFFDELYHSKNSELLDEYIKDS